MNSSINEMSIEKILIECRRLLTRSVTDLPEFSTKEKIVKSYSCFIRERNNSFKKSELILIDEILRIENEIERLKKKKRDVSLRKRIKTLKGLKLLLELFFNTFIWIVLDWDRSKVKKIFKGSKFGMLRYQNINSVLEYMNEYNENPNIFIVPLDFCRYSCISDILQVIYNEDTNSIRIDSLEMKSGRVNEEMTKTILSGKADSYFDFFNKYGEKGIKQMERFFRQQKFHIEKWELINADQGIYENPDNPDQNLVIVAFKSNIEFYTNIIIRLLEAADREDFAVEMIDYCLVIGAINKKNFKIASLGEYDTRLFIYHTFINPNSLYEKKYPPGWVETLKKIQLEDWREGFGSVILTPIATRQIPTHFLMDLLFGRKKLVYYFNAERFIELCKSMKLNASFTRLKGINREELKGLAKFNGKFIKISHQDCESIMGNGLFHEMFYNWIRPRSLIEIKKSIEIPIQN